MSFSGTKNRELKTAALIGAAVAIFAALAFVHPTRSHAQLNFELPCPSGSVPLQDGISLNPQTGLYRAYLCRTIANGQVIFNDLSTGTQVPSLTNVILPAFSQATINSITNSAGTSTMNCNAPFCGLQVGQQIVLGQALPLICQGPWTISGVSGNTASFTSASCIAAAGPYVLQIGQNGRAFTIQNQVANPSSVFACITNYDSQLVCQANANGVENSAFDLDTNGQVGLIAFQNGGGLYVDPSGNTCVGGNGFGAAPGNLSSCKTGLGFGSTDGVVNQYRGFSTNSGGVGLPFIFCKQVSRQSTNLTLTCTLAASGYGTQGLMKIEGAVYCVSTCVSSTGVVTVGFKDATNTAQTLSTCSTTANLGCYAIGAGTATTFSAVDVYIPFSIPIVVAAANQNTVTVTVTVTGAPTYDAYIHGAFYGN